MKGKTMPQESISLVNTNGTEMPNRVEVSWAIDRDVSICVGYTEGNIIDRVYGPGSLAKSGFEGEFAALWTTLDREGINRVIRLLRKARDAAYGRDE